MYMCLYYTNNDALSSYLSKESRNH